MKELVALRESMDITRTRNERLETQVRDSIQEVESLREASAFPVSREFKQNRYYASHRSGELYPPVN